MIFKYKIIYSYRDRQNTPSFFIMTNQQSLAKLLIPLLKRFLDKLLTLPQVCLQMVEDPHQIPQFLPVSLVQLLQQTCFTLQSLLQEIIYLRGQNLQQVCNNKLALQQISSLRRTLSSERVFLTDFQQTSVASGQDLSFSICHEPRSTPCVQFAKRDHFDKDVFESRVLQINQKKSDLKNISISNFLKTNEKDSPKEKSAAVGSIKKKLLKGVLEAGRDNLRSGLNLLSKSITIQGWLSQAIKKRTSRRL